MEMVGPISVWSSELSAPRRIAFRMLPPGVGLGGVQGASFLSLTGGHRHILPSDSVPGTADGVWLLKTHQGSGFWIAELRPR